MATRFTRSRLFLELFIASYEKVHKSEGKIIGVVLRQTRIETIHPLEVINIHSYKTGTTYAYKKLWNSQKQSTNECNPQWAGHVAENVKEVIEEECVFIYFSGTGSFAKFLSFDL
ncbi:hypothetical protein RB195_011887 [Necator americanus]|uniref:Uncharacterized protein n=1 Tax=Necator americanus TaxID=51031 RepID=A0ABR1D5G7_NECAM